LLLFNGTVERIGQRATGQRTGEEINTRFHSQSEKHVLPFSGTRPQGRLLGWFGLEDNGGDVELPDTYLTFSANSTSSSPSSLTLTNFCRSDRQR